MPCCAFVVGSPRAGVSRVRSQASPPIRTHSGVEASERVECAESGGIGVRERS